MAIATHFTPRLPDLPALEGASLRALPVRTESLPALPSLSDTREDEVFFMLSAIARLGVAAALNERVIIDPILLNRYVGPELRNLGYRPTNDPVVLAHPRTREDGWIMELSQGLSLWGCSYIVGGHIEGKVSKDLFYAVEQAKAIITDKFFALFKHPGLRTCDQLELRAAEPTRTIFKEIKNFRDAQAYAAAHAADLPDIKAALPVYWNRPTH